MRVATGRGWSGWPARARALVLALTVALVAALAAVVVLAVTDGQSSDEAPDAAALAAAGTQAEKAARAAVVRMTTYDYRTVDDDFSWVDDAGTDDFGEYFASSREETAPLIRRLQVIATGTVVDSAVKTADLDHARVLLFVDQTIRVADEKGTKLDQPRVVMQMVREDGRWLVDAVSLDDLVGG